MNFFHRWIVQASDENGREEIEEALQPPNKMNRVTGLPHGWVEDEELSGFREIMRA